MSSTARPSADGPVDPLATLRGVHARRFDREGIPMVLALVDERRPGADSPRAAQPSVLADGERFARLTGAYRDGLLPDARDNDPWAQIVVLQAMSYAHLDPPPDPGTGPGPTPAPGSAAATAGESR